MQTTPLTQQQLYWLLASLGLTLAIHAPNLPIWVTVVCALIVAWRFAAIRKPALMPNRWLLVLLSLLTGLGILLSFKGQFGRDASLSLLVLMTVLKLLETKRLRDYMLTIMLAYFLIGNLFLFNQSMLTFALSIPPLILLTATLINISLKTPQSWQFLGKLAGKLLLQSVPVMLILFVLFPRIPGPLWGIPQDAYSGMTGLGDNLKFGNISNLTQNSSVAFRVQFKNKFPPNNQLYWRGPVLWHQNKNEWLMPSKAIGLRNEVLETTGAPIDYTITLEPHNRTWLLMLDMPMIAPANTNFTHDYSAVSKEPVRTRIRYNGSSYSQYQLGVALDDRERTLSLQLTEGENPKTFQLAKDWQNLTPEQKINQALQMFRQQNFIYTLRPPILRDNPIDAFLFDTRKGFCEHYAASFVYLMRAAGLPARIVTGYQGGELNPNGNYLIVRQSDAHAWAEVWLENKGWVRIDPTAAVSPERIEQGISEALRDSDQLPLFARRDFPLLRKAFLNFDSINNGWNQWVLGYDDKKQMEFLNSLTGKKLTLADLVFYMMGAIVLVILATSYFLFKKTKLKLNPAQQLYQQYLAQLKRANLQPIIGEGALDFGNRVGSALPAKAGLAKAIAEEYNSLQYSMQYSALQANSHAPSGGIQKLAQLISDFKLSPTELKKHA
jgi:protein-glutamine gamma-glutamyltransferase